MPEKPLVKIIPKPKPKIPGWLNFLFWLSLLLGFCIIGSFFYFRYQISVLEKKENSLGNQISELEKKIDEDLKKERVAEISEKITYFSKLLKEQKTSSKVFEFLKSVTHPRVQITSLNLDVKNYKMSLEAVTDNFQTLAEQILVLRENQYVQNLEVLNISLTKEGKVEFALNFTLKEEIYKK